MTPLHTEPTTHYWQHLLANEATPGPPWRLAYPVRLMYVFLQMPQNTFLAVTIWGSGISLYDHYASLGRTWGPSPLEDQQIAGGVMWLGGDILFLAAMAAILAGWMRHEQRGAAAGDRRDDRARAAIREREGRLAERVAEYARLGAQFAKWRAVITIGDGIPSHNCIHANAHALARYAAICQAGGIVPMVEPEVLMDGDNDIDTCAEVTEWALRETFLELNHAGVALEGIILKPNMVISGKKCATQASREEVAEKTLKVLKRCVPAAVPGIAFLSGGQASEDATAHLHYMNAAGPLPWKLTYSYGRALQADALKAWGGKPGNVAAARKAFAHRARMNGLAASGKWTQAGEVRV